MQPTPTALQLRSSVVEPDGETSLTLLDGAKRRDDEAWRRLEALYAPLLRYWCGRWGLHPEDVDDVTQEVFQAVAIGLDRFRRDRDGDSFRGWLHGVTRHKALDFLRRSRPRSLGGLEFHRVVSLLQAPADDEERAPIRDLYRDALEVVRVEFEDRTWHAFWRTAVDGLTPRYVADDLGVTPASVRQSKSRVLRRLKEVLGESPSLPGGHPRAENGLLPEIVSHLGR